MAKLGYSNYVNELESYQSKFSIAINRAGNVDITFSMHWKIFTPTLLACATPITSVAKVYRIESRSVFVLNTPSRYC
jgi:hypothetical protein